jgi:FkbM family methyltransferase
MKNTIKYILHSLLGFRNYLFLFARYKVLSLKRDKKEGDFFRFLELVPEGSAVLDIGANIGVMSVHLSRKVGEKGRVYSFEPLHQNIDAFKRIIDHYKLKNVTLFEIALGNTEGSVEMVMPVVGSVKMHGLSHVVHSSITDFNEGIKYNVPLKKLDGLTELQSGPAISGIKIDIENYEYFALDGGKELIRKFKPVVYAELWENDNRYNCFRLMDELGYKVYISENGKLVPFDPLKDKKQNFIFIPA